MGSCTSSPLKQVRSWLDGRFTSSRCAAGADGNETFLDQYNTAQLCLGPKHERTSYVPLFPFGGEIVKAVSDRLPKALAALEDPSDEGQLRTAFLEQNAQLMREKLPGLATALIAMAQPISLPATAASDAGAESKSPASPASPAQFKVTVAHMSDMRALLIKRDGSFRVLTELVHTFRTPGESERVKKAGHLVSENWTRGFGMGRQEFRNEPVPVGPSSLSSSRMRVVR